MADVKNIVVIGASFAGLSVSHYYHKHIKSALRSAGNDTQYQLVLIDRSTHFWWRVGAPRACVDVSAQPHDQTFTSIVEGFKQYGSNAVVFHHGEVTSIDTTSRNVTFKPVSEAADAPTTIAYEFLFLSPGTNTPSPLTSLVGPHTITMQALENMNKKLQGAKEVIIAGGGPIGVEIAGEIGEHLNGSAGWFSSRPAVQKAKVTLITAGPKLLPILSDARALKAEKLLNRVGVDVIYNSKVGDVDESASKTTVRLSNGTTMTADVYIPATGAQPNTTFVPKQLLNEAGYINTNHHSLRVEGAGSGVYCVGDAGSHTRGGILAIYDQVPVAMASLAKDMGLADWKSGQQGYKDSTLETQIVPIGHSKGVGAFNSYSMPGIVISMVKGKDYMLSHRFDITEGNKFKTAGA